jgi:hypothetical protein
MTDETAGMEADEWEERQGLDHLEQHADDPHPVTVGTPARTTGVGLGLIDALDRALIELGGRIGELAGNPVAQVRIHARLDDVRRNIGVVTDAVERLLYDELPERVNRVKRTVKDRLVLEGVGVVEPIDKGGRWVDVNFEAALVAVFEALGVRGLDAEGEVIDAPHLARTVGSMVGFSALKSNKHKGTGLISLGLDRASFATYQTGEAGVRIIPNEEME